jgi:hypothetical protein
MDPESSVEAVATRVATGLLQMQDWLWSLLRFSSSDLAPDQGFEP